MVGTYPTIDVPTVAIDSLWHACFCFLEGLLNLNEQSKWRAQMEKIVHKPPRLENAHGAEPMRLVKKKNLRKVKKMKYSPV